jgi:hypothetical protein
MGARWRDPRDIELDEEVWTLLSEVVLAANRGDQVDFASSTTALTQTLDLQRQRLAGLYLWYLLRFRIVALVGNRPTESDLMGLVDRSRSRFAAIADKDPSLLGRTLLSAFNIAEPADSVTGAEFSVASSVALGVLLEDPVSDLDPMRPPLIRWCHHHSDEYWTAITKAV